MNCLYFLPIPSSYPLAAQEAAHKYQNLAAFVSKYLKPNLLPVIGLFLNKFEILNPLLPNNLYFIVV